MEPCGTDPLTGFYRDGCCSSRTRGRRPAHHLRGHDRRVPGAPGLHRQRPVDAATGVPLSRPVPGDRWCVTAANWLKAYEDGRAAPVVMASTHERTLEVVPLEALAEHAVDVPDDPGDL